MNLSKQIRMARAAENWTRQELSKRAAISIDAIRNLEENQGSPRFDTINKIKRVFELEGYEFLDGGIQQKDVSTIFFDGDEAYLKLLASIHECLKNQESEILFHCADETKSSDAVIKKKKDMQADGIKMRSTICEGNYTIHGNINHYRWLDPDYYAGADVFVIYGNRVAFDLGTKIMQVRNPALAGVFKRQFEYFWKTGKKVGAE